LSFPLPTVKNRPPPDVDREAD